MCGRKIRGGVTGQNQNWCLENPGFPFKNRFSGKKTVFSEIFLRKCLKRQKGLLYAENSEKSLFFGKFHPPHQPPQLFFGTFDGVNPPTLMYGSTQ